MGVTTSNTDMFTTDTALAMLVALRPALQEHELVFWRNKGSDAILAEVTRIKALNKVTGVKEEENADAASPVAKKSK